MRHAMTRAAVVMMAALAAWGVQGRPAAAQDVSFEEVVFRLRAPEPKTRLDAVRLLRQSGYIDAAMPLTGVITDASSDVQLAAIETALSLFLVDEAYTRDVTRDAIKARDASLAARAFAQGRGATVGNVAPPPMTAALATAVSAADQRVRLDALWTIGVLGPAQATRSQFPDPKVTIPKLLNALRDSAPVVRIAAADVLGRLYDAALRDPAGSGEVLATRTEAGDALITAMNDPNQDVRQAAILAVGRLRYDRAVQSLIDFFAYYQRDKLGLATLEALGRLAHPSCVEPLAKAFELRDYDVRRLAIEGTGRVGDRAAVTSIISRINADAPPELFLAAAFSRAKVGDYSEVWVILDAFKIEDLQSLAYGYLVELGPAVVPSLGVVSNYSDPRVRAALAEALGSIGNASTLPALDALVKDKDRRVVSAAERSQARLTLRQPGQPRRP